jgi:hypothetical protein
MAAAMTMTTGLYAQTGTLTIDVKDITPTDATVTITPSSDDLKYYWGMSDKTVFENNGGADKAIENRINIWKSTASYYDDGTTWQEMMYYDLKSGPTDESVTERFDFYPDTDYVVYAFGMDAEGNVSAPLVLKEFTNKAPSFTGTLAIEVTDKEAMDATVVVTPAPADLTYYWGMSTKTKFEADGGVDKAVENRINIWKASASYYDDTTWQEMMSYDLKNGETSEKLSERFDLTPATDYVIYGFGISAEGEQTTPVVTADFSTVSGTASDNTFTIGLVSVQPDNTGRMNVKVNVAPANADTYTVRLVEKKYLVNYDMTPGSEGEKNFINDFMLYQLTDNYIYSGEQTLSYTGCTADADYGVYVIGVDANKAASTALASLGFKTVRFPERYIELSVTDITPMNAHIKVTPSDPEMHYYIDIAPTKLVEEKGGVEIIPEKFIIDWWKFIADMYEDTKWQDLIPLQTRTGDLDTTVADLVAEGILSNQYWNEDWTLYAVGFSLDGEIITETAVVDYSAPAPAQSDMTFIIEPVSCVKDDSTSAMEPYTATIDIIPSRTDEEFKVNYTRTSTYDSWVNNEDYGLNEFIKSQWLENAVSFTDAVRLQMPGLYRYADFEQTPMTYTVLVMGWNEGPTTEPAMYEVSYTEAGVSVTPADKPVIIGGENRIEVYGNCENVAVYSATGSVMGVLRNAGAINVPAGIYVVSYTHDGKTESVKVAVK